MELLDELSNFTPTERPVPNLGFACLNATLRAQKPPIYTNRDCIKVMLTAYRVTKLRAELKMLAAFPLA